MCSKLTVPKIEHKKATCALLCLKKKSQKTSFGQIMFYELQLLLLALLVLTYLRHLRRSWRWRHVPGFHWALSLPVIGHGYFSILSKHGHSRKFMEAMRDRYGDVFRYDLGPHPIVFVCKYEVSY